MSSRSRVRKRAARGPWWGRVTLIVLALLVSGGAVYAGLRAGAPDHPAATRSSRTPTPSPTPLADVDLSALPIARGPFCDRLDRADVQTALGAPVSAATHYGSGDRVRLTTGLTDVSHEFDCTFDAADGTEARVWVFAEPVTRTVGQSIASDARREPRCALVRRSPTFGTPSVATLCRAGRPAARAVTLRGLFADAWLSCRLSTPGAAGEGETIRRAEQWCVRVATTLGARP